MDEKDTKKRKHSTQQGSTLHKKPRNSFGSLQRLLLWETPLPSHSIDESTHAYPFTSGYKIFSSLTLSNVAMEQSDLMHNPTTFIMTRIFVDPEEQKKFSDHYKVNVERQMQAKVPELTESYSLYENDSLQLIQYCQDPEREQILAESTLLPKGLVRLITEYDNKYIENTKTILQNLRALIGKITNLLTQRNGNMEEYILSLLMQEALSALLEGNEIFKTHTRLPYNYITKEVEFCALNVLIFTVFNPIFNIRGPYSKKFHDFICSFNLQNSSNQTDERTIRFGKVNYIGNEAISAFLNLISIVKYYHCLHTKQRFYVDSEEAQFLFQNALHMTRGKFQTDTPNTLEKISSAFNCLSIHISNKDITLSRRGVYELNLNKGQFILVGNVLRRGCLQLMLADSKSSPTPFFSSESNNPKKILQDSIQQHSFVDSERLQEFQEKIIRPMINDSQQKDASFLKILRNLEQQLEIFRSITLETTSVADFGCKIACSSVENEFTLFTLSFLRG